MYLCINMGISVVYPSVYFGLHVDGMLKLYFDIYACVDFSSKLNL